MMGSARSLLGVVACVAVVGISSQVRADQCKDYGGPFSSVFVPPPQCQSPIGMCTHGVTGGDFPGDYDFTFTFLMPAGDPNDPTKFVYGGTSVISPYKHKGQIFTTDTGFIHITGNPFVNPLVTTSTIVGGTDHWKKTTGTFVATGNNDFTTGTVTGSFTANLCHKDKD